jgi:U2-associated protein SR140
LQKADEEAAKIYEEFVESFKSEEEPTRDAPGVKAFVHGGVAMPGSRQPEAGTDPC